MRSHWRCAWRMSQPDNRATGYTPLGGCPEVGMCCPEAFNSNHIVAMWGLVNEISF